MSEEREVKDWITIHGNHVPIYEGQTKDEAAKNFINRNASIEDRFHGAYGERHVVEDPAAKIDSFISEASEDSSTWTINPHYGEEQQKGQNYHNNCCVCTAATMMQMLGYDMEAGVQPDKENEFVQPSRLFKADFTNPDNFMMSDADAEDVRRTMGSTLEAKMGTNEFAALTPDERMTTIKDLRSKINITPRGKTASKAVENLVQNWGENSWGEIKVTWKNGNVHSMFIYNDHGKAKIYDGQCNKIIDNIEELLSKTRANNTWVVRYDNFLKWNYEPDRAIERCMKVRNKK